MLPDPAVSRQMGRVLCGLLLLHGFLGAQADTALLIKGGTVVNSDRSFKADVLIEGSTIAAVGASLKVPRGATVLDASGKLVFPGGIDTHTHLEFPFMGQVAKDDFYSGHRAALAGGTTFHIDFALPEDGDLLKGVENYHRKAEKAVMDYGLHMAINIWNDKISQQMPAVVEAGINSFKFFFAYKGAMAVGDDVFLQGIVRSKDLGALPMVHGENADAILHAQKRTFEAGITGPEGHSLSRPAFIEGEGTGRAIKLARLVNAPLYVVHVMSQDALTEIQLGLQAGQRLYGEALAGALALTDERCWDPDFKQAAAAVMSPPLRSREHRAAIRQALAGGLLHVIGTDHCGWNSTQKAKGRDDFRIIPNGIHGIEERLHLAWETLVNTGLITPSDFVRLTSTTAARLFNVYPRKGVIQAGSDADVVIFNPTKEHKLGAHAQFSGLDMSLYEGMAIKGKVETTISRGRIAFQKDEILVERGSGRFVKLPPWAPAVFDGLQERDTQWIKETFPYGKTPVDRSTNSAAEPGNLDHVTPSKGKASAEDEL